MPELVPDDDKDSDDEEDNNVLFNLDWIPYIIKGFQSDQSIVSTISSVFLLILHQLLLKLHQLLKIFTKIQEVIHPGS